jgi:hypothetical protein
MENKKVNATQVALYVAIGLGVVGVVGGLMYSVKRLWYGKSNPVQEIKNESNNQAKEQESGTEMKTISKDEVFNENNLADDS